MFSEGNFFDRSWQQSFWGPNYARLQTVKAKYDPEGLFFVHHGVGSEDRAPMALCGSAAFSFKSSVGKRTR
jgi:hypothetical protein